MSVVEEIKQKTDIVEVISQYTPLTKSGKTFRGLCPFHSEKHGSFFVYPDQQTWHCFGACATGGDVFSFIMKKDGVTFGDALKLLAERSGVVIPQYAAAEKAHDKHERLYQANEAAAEYYHQLLLKSPEALQVQEYLAKRGLNSQSVEDFKMGYAPNAWDSLQKHLEERGYSTDELMEAGLLGVSDTTKKVHDRFRHRLLFPISDVRGRIIGFGGRALDDAAQPKYLNSPQTPLFDKSSNLYGLHLAKDAMRKEEQAVIVEGYMDVILPHQYGFKNVIASMGTAIGESHITILKKMTKNLVLALDPDSAGESAMLRSVGLENTLGAEMRVAIMPDGKDPDEIVMRDPAEWKKLIAAAVPILDFTFDKLTKDLDLKTAKGKSSAVEVLMPLVSQIKDPVRQGFYLEKLGGLVGQSTRKLEPLLVKSKSAPRPKAASQEERKASVSNPIEEYTLSMLLKHPELLEHCGELQPEYFDCSENRQVYNGILACTEPSGIKAALDEALWEHYDRLVSKTLIDSRLEAKVADAVLRLREEHLKRLAHNRADSPAVDEGNQLRELFVKKEQLGEQKRRQK
jgi:DNA primase